MERLYIEETHNKLHEETEQELVGDLLDKEERRSETVEELAEYLAFQLGHDKEYLLKLLKQNR